MTKQEYYRWWHDTRVAARKSADKQFTEYPDALTCSVPYFKPFYATTKENAGIKESKQITNALARIHGQEEPYPEESMIDYVVVKR